MGLRGLLEATRPWSFPMTVLVSLTVIAYAASTGSRVDPALALIAIAGSVLLHAAANLFNDYFDYRYGVDRPGVGTAVYRSHPILSGTLTPPGLLAYTLALAGAGAALAAATLESRPLALPLALLGLAAAYSYTGPPLKAKYRALGELLVYIAWGILIPVGVYYMATGRLSLAGPAAALPPALLVVSVLTANNVRDAETDRRAGLVTMATLLGRRRAQALLAGMVAAAYAAQAAIAAWLGKPLALLALASLPKAASTVRSLTGEEVPPDADPRAAQVALAFTSLALAGYAVDALLH